MRLVSVAQILWRDRDWPCESQCAKEKERILNLAISKTPEPYEADSRVLTGAAAHELERVSGGFDLMVTGSRSWGPLRRTMLGSTTRKLMRSAACPVLVVPRGVGVDPLGVRDPRSATALHEPTA